MFPDVEKSVVHALLDVNGNRLQKTIDSLLIVTNDQTPEFFSNSSSGACAEGDRLSSGPLGEKNTLQSCPEQQLVDDEILARSLQAQWSETSHPNDEHFAANLERMEKDERMARKLQSLEKQKSEYYNSDIQYPFYVRRSGPGTTYEPDQTEKIEEPISTQIDRKLTELGQDIKSGLSIFASKITQAFQPSSPPPPSLALTSEPVQTVQLTPTLMPIITPTKTPTHPPIQTPTQTSPLKKPTPTQPIEPTTSNHISLFEIGDQEEKELISSEEEDYPLIDKRKERKSDVVLMINTE